MIVGTDFEKIEFEFFNLNLLEPSAFIGDFILFILAHIFAFKILKKFAKHTFYKNWLRFFLCFGISMLIGGFGHLFWNYWGVEGKYFSWYAGIASVFFIERAMISIHRDKRVRKIMYKSSMIKLILAYTALTYILITQDVYSDVSKGLLIPSINMAVGLIFALGFLPIHYQKKQWIKSRPFILGLVIIIPSAFFQFMKINIAPWMDRNDMSHILLFCMLLLFYQGIRHSYSHIRCDNYSK